MNAMQIEYLPTNTIQLDARNPRVSSALDAIADGNITQEYLALALDAYAPEDADRHGGSTTYSSLKASIRANKGLMQAIIVTPNDDGSYIVIEGNTRVAIYRELALERAPGTWDTIPAVVMKKITETAEHAIRLQAHLVGPRPWRAYEKAKYLHDLYYDQKLSITEILDFCGGSGRKREIEEYIHAYQDMEKHYIPIVGQATPDYSRFSAFVELQKQNVKAALARAGYTLDDFAQWVHDSRLNPLQNVRKLPRILANPEAKQQFLTHDAREAVRYLEQPTANAIIKDATIEQIAAALTAKIRSLDLQDIKALIEHPDDLRGQTLQDCFEELQFLRQQIGLNTDE